MSLREPAQTPESPGQEPPMPSAIARTPDRLDRLIAFFGWLERNLRWIVLIAIGAWVWYLGAIFTTTALLRNSAAAQTFFVNLLAEMQWSGYTILVLIGLGSWYCLRYPTTGGHAVVVIPRFARCCAL